MCSGLAGRRSRGEGGPHSPGPLPPARQVVSAFLGETVPLGCFRGPTFLRAGEGKSWAIRAGGATGQVSLATTLWGRQKDGFASSVLASRRRETHKALGEHSAIRVTHG